MSRSLKAMMVLLALGYAGLRMVNLDQLVTTDEPLWLGRSANFFRALVTGDLADTWQMAHPGVLTMWAGALAFALHVPGYATLVPFNLDTPMDIEWVLRGIEVDPLAVMVTAKIVKVLLQTLFFACALVFCVRLFGPWIAVVAGILIAGDPFLSGLDSALHVDGLFAMTCFTALLALVHAAERTSLVGGRVSAPWAWGIAGALCACAWLTRATGVILFGMMAFVLAWLIIRELRSGRPGTDRSSVLLGASVCGWVWLASAAAVTLLLLPALWTAPFDVAMDFIAWNVEAALSGHENPTFFMGDIHDGDAGSRFYPLALIWRTTPVTWLGLLLLMAGGLWAWRARLLTPGMAQALVTLVVFAVGFNLAMSLGAKKFDRYMLPVFPIFDLLAAAGFGIALPWVQSMLPGVRRTVPIVLATVLAVGQVWATLSVMPYRLDYFNPVMGGTAGAESMFQLGWGQGADQVVDHLLAEGDGAAETLVRVSGTPQAFTYFLPDGSGFRVIDRNDTTLGWCEVDWYVAGIQQTQRDLDAARVAFDHIEPDFVARVEGITYFEVFDLRDDAVRAGVGLTEGCDG